MADFYSKFNPVKSTQKKLGTTNATDRAAKVQKMLAYNKDKTAQLKAAGVDTSDVEKPNENALFRIFREAENVMGVTGTREFVARLAEGKPLSNKNAAGSDILAFVTGQKGSEAEEAFWGGVLPNLLIRAGILSGNPYIGGAGVAVGGLMRLRDATVGNDYIKMDNPEDARQAIGTEIEEGKTKQSSASAILNAIDPSGGMSHNKILNFATGILSEMMLDPTTGMSSGVKLGTKAKYMSEFKRMMVSGVYWDDLVKTLGEADALKFFENSSDEVKTLLEQTKGIKAFGKAIEDLDDFAPGIALGNILQDPEVANRFAIGVFKQVRDTLGDKGGLKYFGLQVLDNQEDVDKYKQALKWGLINSDSMKGVIQAFGKAADYEKNIGEISRGTANAASKFLRGGFGAGRFGDLLTSSADDVGDYATRVLKRETENALGRAGFASRDARMEIKKLLDTDDMEVAATLAAGLRYGPTNTQEFDQLRTIMRSLRKLQGEIRDLQEKMPRNIESGWAASPLHSRWLQSVGNASPVDPESLAKMRKELDELNVRYINLEHLRREKQAQLLVEYGEKFQRKVLADTGMFTDEQIDRIMAAIEIFRKRMNKIRLDENGYGVPVLDLFGDGAAPSAGYIPGVFPIMPNEKEITSSKKMVEAFGRLLGMDTEDISYAHAAIGKGKSFFASTNDELHAKKFIDPFERLVKGKLPTELHMSKLAGYRQLKSGTREAEQSIKQAMVSTFGQFKGVEKLVGKASRPGTKSDILRAISMADRIARRGKMTKADKAERMKSVAESLQAISVQTDPMLRMKAVTDVLRDIITTEDDEVIASIPQIIDTLKAAAKDTNTSYVMYSDDGFDLIRAIAGVLSGKKNATGAVYKAIDKIRKVAKEAGVQKSSIDDSIKAALFSLASKPEEYNKIASKFGWDELLVRQNVEFFTQRGKDIGIKLGEIGVGSAPKYADEEFTLDALRDMVESIDPGSDPHKNTAMFNAFFAYLYNSPNVQTAAKNLKSMRTPAGVGKVMKAFATVLANEGDTDTAYKALESAIDEWFKLNPEITKSNEFLSEVFYQMMDLAGHNKPELRRAIFGGMQGKGELALDYIGMGRLRQGGDMKWQLAEGSSKSHRVFEAVSGRGYMPMSEGGATLYWRVIPETEDTGEKVYKLAYDGVVDGESHFSVKIDHAFPTEDEAISTANALQMKMRMYDDQGLAPDAVFKEIADGDAGWTSTNSFVPNWDSIIGTRKTLQQTPLGAPGAPTFYAAEQLLYKETHDASYLEAGRLVRHNLDATYLTKLKSILGDFDLATATPEQREAYTYLVSKFFLYDMMEETLMDARKSGVQFFEDDDFVRAVLDHIEDFRKANGGLVVNGVPVSITTNMVAESNRWVGAAADVFLTRRSDFLGSEVPRAAKYFRPRIGAKGLARAATSPERKGMLAIMFGDPKSPEYARSFFGSLVSESGKAGKTYERQSKTLIQFTNWLFSQTGVSSWDDVTQDDILRYMSESLESGTNQNTLDKELGTLDQFFSYLSKSGVVKNQMNFKRPGGLRQQWAYLQARTGKFVTNAGRYQKPSSSVVESGRKFVDNIGTYEMMRLSKVSNFTDSVGGVATMTKRQFRDYLVVMILAFTGMRPEELAGMSGDDLLKAIGDASKFEVVGKGSKPITYPMSGAVRKLIKEYVDKFATKDGKVLSNALDLRMGEAGARQINDIVRAAAKRAGIGDVTAKTLRHAKATMLMQSGASLDAIKTAIGHSDETETAAHYLSDLYAYSDDAFSQHNINNRIANAWEEITGGKPIGSDVSIDDIIKEMPSRGTGAERSIFSPDFQKITDELKAKLEADDAATGRIDPSEIGIPDGHVLKTISINGERFLFSVPTGVAKFMDEFGKKVFSNDETFKAFLKTFDTAMNLWKRQATVLRIGFHTRNKLSNMFLMAVAGFFDPEDWAHSYGIISGAYDDRIFELGAKSYTGKEIRELAQANRARIGMLESSELMGTGIGVSSHSDTFADALQTGVGINPFRDDSKVSKFMQHLGTDYVEDADRVATFMTALRKGHDPYEAGLIVDKVLYDYSPMALSLFESGFLKRMIPFYTWMKNNTPAMARAIVQNPYLFMNLRRAAEGTFDVQNEDRSLMPEYLSKNEPVFMLPFKDSKGNNIVMNMAIPLADVARPFDTSDMFSSLNPFAKMMMEYKQNYDLYFDRPIASTPGQKRQMPTMIYPINYALSNKLSGPAWEAIKGQLGIVEKKDEQTGKTYLAGDAYAIKFMKDISPLLNTTSKMGVAPTESMEQSASDILSEMLGIKFTPYNKQDLQFYKTYEEFGKVQELVGKAKAENKIPTGKQKKSKKKKQKKLTEVLGVK